MPTQPADRIVVGRAGEGSVLVDAHHPTIDNQILEQCRRQPVTANEVGQRRWGERPPPEPRDERGDRRFPLPGQSPGGGGGPDPPPPAPPGAGNRRPREQ